MGLPGLLPLTDFKKNYNFYWQLIGFKSMDSLQNASFLKNVNAVLFKVYAITNMLYVSQLAQKIDLPDDELDIERISVGLVEYPVVTKVKMSDISVTYLEDTGNTVYQFHKMWMNCVVKKGSGFSLDAMEPYAMEGWYIPLDKSQNELEAVVNTATSGLLDNLANPMNFVAQHIGSSGAHIYNPITDPGISPLNVRGLQIYPKIFPTDIRRGTMDKSGKSISTITVTYCRIPKLMNGRKPLWRGAQFNAENSANTFKS